MEINLFNKITKVILREEQFFLFLAQAPDYPLMALVITNFNITHCQLKSEHYNHPLEFSSVEMSQQMIIVNTRTASLTSI